jgi:hypothetical protein
MYGKMEKNLQRQRKYHRKHKHTIKQEKEYKDLGTGWLRETPSENPEKEIEDIQKEKRRLGLAI